MAKAQSFPYISVEDARGDVAERPLLPFTLSYQQRRIEVLGLLDSGADINVLPYHLGLELGASWSEQPLSLQLSGNLANYEARGIVLIGTVGQFSSVELVFAWTRAEGAPLILGQMNFFAEFDVCFFRSQFTFEVQSKSS
jgi:hypothetical protein